ncbi:MAG: hypothetical protein KC917_06325 [Candidatus Omnitrophica bacterium]|nr:hypothetical protein [Candidatus Omnitrophota bacterium]
MTHKKGERQIGSHFSNYLFGPFLLPVDEKQIIRNVNFFRFVMGLLVAHRFLVVFGVAVVSSPEGIRLLMASGAFLGVLISIGFMTPIAIVLFTSLFLISPPLFGTLGDQAAIIVFWLLILLGGGKHYSVDSLLSRWSPLKRPIESLYFFAVRLTPENFSRVRFFGIMVFWGVNFSAVAFHFFDEFWLQGDVLQVAMATGFWNDHYQFANAVKDGYPLLFHTLCRAGLYIQAIFETFLLLFMYLGWPGRMFVFLQGLGFFLMSLLFFNLGYLPLHELVMWGILFGYLPAIFPFLARGAKKAGEERIANFGPHPINGLITLAFTIGFIFNLLNFARICGHPWNGYWPWNQPVWRAVHRTFAYEAVNVFNRDDLATGGYRMVLYEVDEEGVPIRLVPLMDLNGGRLDYLRNDYIYYGRVLRWLRAPESEKFVDGDYENLGDKTKQVLNTMITLDAAVTGPTPGRTYRMEIGRRSLQDGDYFLVWGDWETLVEKEYHLQPAVAKKISKDAPFTFVLGPGHWGAAERAARSLEILKERQPSPAGHSG